MTLDKWAARWHIPPVALAELKASMGIYEQPCIVAGISEAAVQQQIRLEAGKHGVALFRNNNGACMDGDGRMVRYGLANDSKAMNEKLKSHDLIGITPHVVTVQDVGSTVGIFTSVEVKRAGWKFTGTKREKAQLAWSELVIKLGGRAMFATSPEEVFSNG
jgi:hypothetical protein